MDDIKANKQPGGSHPLEKVVLTVACIIAILALLNQFVYPVIASALQQSLYSSLSIAMITIVVVIAGAFVVYKILTSALKISPNTSDGAAETLKVIIRIALYAVIIMIVLSFLHVDIGTILAGSAIGGIIIGLAVQTIATNILSGFFVSSSKTLKKGDIIVLKTTSLGEIPCQVVKVNLLLTEVLNQNGNLVRIPNSVLMGSATFTKLKSKEGSTYPLKVMVNSDAPTDKIMSSAEKQLADSFKKMGMPAPQVYLLSKDGFTNTFSVVIKNAEFSALNGTISVVNSAFDAAYWDAKK